VNAALNLRPMRSEALSDMLNYNQRSISWLADGVVGFLTTVSVSSYVKSKSRTIYKLKRIWKETVEVKSSTTLATITL
jgi:hypothetical protein